jgi:stachyose synthetase
VSRDIVLLKLCGDDGGAGGGEVGLKTFLKDMWRRFLTLGDVYVCQALYGGWGAGCVPMRLLVALDMYYSMDTAT